MRQLLILLLMSAVAVDLQAQAYRYPDVPDSLHGQQQRAAYLTEHFWDNANLEDPTLFAKPKVILDYLYLLYMQPVQERPLLVEKTVRLFAPYPEQVKWLAFLFDRYLHNKESRYHNDTLYQQALDAILQTDLEDIHADILIRAREVSSMNLVGERAENFAFQYKNGTTDSLYSIEAPYLLLIFNNPGCARCQHAEHLISKNDTLQQMVTAKRLKILAITVDEDYDSWQQHSYPANWICGYDYTHTIIDDMLYEIRSYPSFYLLDSNKHVLIREADYNTINNYIQRLTRLSSF